MRWKALCLAMPLLAALATLPAEVVGQAKGQKVQAQPATEQDYYLIQNQKTLTAQLLSFDDASHTISVRIDFPEWVPNPKYRPNVGAQRSLMRDYQQMMQQQAQVMRSRNMRQMQQHMVRMAQLQNRIAMDMMRTMNTNPNNAPFMKKDHLKDFDLDLQEKVVYRKKFLTEIYDDTGNIKKYTPEEKKKLVGNNKPKDTYVATADEFHPGQWVWIYLTKKSDSSSSTSSQKDKTAKDEKDADLHEKSVPRPTVTMLVIAQEGSLPANSQNLKQKKKN